MADPPTPSTDAPADPAKADPWTELRALTDARIALGRAGTSLPTAAHLTFQLDHARARDAVHTKFEPAQLQQALQAHSLSSIAVSSQAPQRADYLRRPDLGRRLEPADTGQLPAGNYDVVLILADGLSAVAAHRHGVAMTQALYQGLQRRGIVLAPVVIASGARVALADDIGATMGAQLAIIFLGERPGLSWADSLGAYLTWSPRVGNTDAQRNCVSNIRPGGGLSYEAATHKLIYLSLESLRRKLSGVDLKDDSADVALLR